jgi:hypothetical protein
MTTIALTSKIARKPKSAKADAKKPAAKATKTRLLCAEWG